MEEHLKTFAIKRMFAETLILPEDLRTKEYFILGMGSYEGQRISASKGIGDTLPVLLEKYGRDLTRVSLLLVSHPSKNFNWSEEVTHFCGRILNRYNQFGLKLADLPEGNNHELDEAIAQSKEAIKRNMQNGDYRTACLESLVELPKKVKKMALKVRGNLDKYRDYINNLFGLN